ncbi:hypothetical protein LWI29_009107 [Acer saccharum]|uniref:Uncharacterized protein n=1 Tax=Acer saccharum TaxID=4024 RepID=A0AA39RRJ3_ACESA|nr:hypothetical protein LWI29_009107 [Acer saccharum]
MREKTAREVFAVYEMLGENSQQRRGRDDSCEERTNADLGMQLANMSREMENLKANFGQQSIMGESRELNSIEVEEPEFVFKSSKGKYDRIDESMRILERVFEEEYGEYEKKVVEVAQKSKELISQDMDLEKKINSLEKERDSSLREIGELKDELA